MFIAVKSSGTLITQAKGGFNGYANPKSLCG
jgi:hypothetical protein